MTAIQHDLADAVAPLLSQRPGVAVAVRCGDQEMFLVRGSSTRGRPHPVGPDTRFEVGSLTKTFTGLLLAEMATRGEVRHDDPVDRYLPVPARGITLEQLATHTSGLPVLPPGLLRSGVPSWTTNPYRHFGPDRVLEALCRTRPRPPRKGVRYSNFAVGVLGHALAAAAGRPFEDLLAERVLRPLGLHDTDCSPTAQATGHNHGRPRPPWEIPGLPAAGALRSTARDLLRYLTAYIHPDNTPLTAALTDSTSPRVTVPGGRNQLCLIWNRRPGSDRDLIFHGGATRGFTTFAGFSPQTRTALVALTNDGPGLLCKFVQRSYDIFRALAAPASVDAG